MTHITVDQAHTRRGNNEPFMLVIKKGQMIREAIETCATEAGLASAALSGIGALCHASIGAYDLSTKCYINQTFVDMHELISLIGNVTTYEGKLLAHMHVSLAGPEGTMFGGHLHDAEVAVTCECLITPLSGPIFRDMDPELKAALIKTD